MEKIETMESGNMVEKVHESLRAALAAKPAVLKLVFDQQQEGYGSDALDIADVETLMNGDYGGLLAPEDRNPSEPEEEWKGRMEWKARVSKELIRLSEELVSANEEDSSRCAEELVDMLLNL